MLRLSALLGSVCIAAVLGCGGSDLVLPSETGPADITLEGGNNQSGPAGEALAESLVVKVVDRRGQPLSSQKVEFSLESEAPGALISPDTAETAADGMAKARWVLGSTSGTQTAVARVVGADRLEITFNATVGPAGAARLQAAGGNDQSGPIGTILEDPLTVRVTDAFGNPVAGVTVNWSAEQGTVDPTSAVTGDDGRAATSWTLGSSTGSQSAAASSAGLSGSPMVFTASAVASGADRLVRVSGNDQSAQVGAELPRPLVVQLLDEAGNGVPDRAVSWVVATGGGSVASGNSSTDSEGRASTQWTLGPDPGGNTLNAVVSGVGVVGFTATATGGGGSSASHLAFQLQPSDTEKDKKITPPVEVVVLDNDGGRVTEGEFEIMLELTGDDDGELKGKRSERTRFGLAIFNDIKVDEEGEYRLRASTDGLPSVESDQFEVQGD